MTIDWQPFHQIKLQVHTAHVIIAELSENPAITSSYWDILSQDEKARANQFRFAIHRNHFIMARGILRLLLAKYTSIPAEDISFKYQNHGKPELNHIIDLPLHFNLSHSGSMAVYALTLNHAIGIDIEHLKPCDEIELAKRFFAKPEYERLLELSVDKRRQQFFQIWTLKEAFIKAIGTGLFQALDQFAVLPEDGGKLIFCQDIDGPAREWFMKVLPYQQHYHVALASKQALKHIDFWQWQT